MATSRRVAGKVGYGLACLAAVVTLVAAGYLHRATGLLDATEKGIAISGSATPATSAMNILVMGLESRTNYEGQPLSVEQLVETHSGNEQSVSDGEVGAQDTDTLILVHIFAGGKSAVGFSIPRDDLVTYPSPTYLGITQGKIDQAYDFAYNQSLGQTYGSSHQHARAQCQPPVVPDPADLWTGERDAAQRLEAGRQPHRRALHPAVREERIQRAVGPEGQKGQGEEGDPPGPAAFDSHGGCV